MQLAPRDGQSLTPISLLTGFLGSGKTTLLGRLLRHPGMAETAVIINEFGEVGLDHHLVAAARGEPVLLDGGCLCCAVQDDLVLALIDLAERRRQGSVPPFGRVVIETSGLADPAPILHKLMSDRSLAELYCLDGVVATVDAVNGARQLDAQEEAVKQAAVADRLVLTKADLAAGPAAAALRERLRRLNPGAPILAAAQGAIDPALLFGAGLYDPASRAPDVRRWLREEEVRDAAAQDHASHDHAHGHDHDHGHAGAGRRHDDRIGAHCFIVEEPFEWDGLRDWVRGLLRERGEDILRVKAIVQIRGEPGPVAIHGVQHVFHDPVPLAAWPDPADRRSKLVFITRDIGRDFIAASLAGIGRPDAA